jgi:dGTPase
VDLCDAIAWSSADLEDALAGGWLRADDLRDLPLWQRAWAKAETDFGDARDIHKRIRATKNVIALLVRDLVDTSRQRIAAMGIDSSDAARDVGEKAVVLSSEATGWLAGLRELLFERVYRHPATVEADAQGRTIIRELFGRFMETPALLPPRYARRIDEQGLPRVICDYIAGMTDRFCRAEHAKIR